MVIWPAEVVMKCRFLGCLKPARLRGLCNGHYQQQKEGKELKPLQVQHHGLSEYERFMKRVGTGSAKECWLWSGSRNNASGKPGSGHGQWRAADGSIELAHRAAWRLMKGEIPNGLCVLHRCDNPPCVNPSHLFLGTHSENVSDMWSKGRARPKQNLGSRHGMAKVTEDLVRDIRSSRESGVEIARRLGITPTTVCDIRKRRTWKHLV